MQTQANLGFLDRFFKLREKNTTVKTEVLAGLTTFIALAYIIFVNPNILSEAGIPKEAAIASTIWIAALSTMVMGVFANYPVALAPGMGLNAFFAYYVCGTLGLHWTVALGAVFFSGVLFLILTVSHIRQAIINSVPQNLRVAISVGIGLFIAFIGLKNAGIIVQNDATFVTIGHLTEGSALLGIIGLLITSVLVIKNVPGSLLVGIIATALIGMPMGLTSFHGMVDVPPSVAPIFCQFEFHNILSIDMVIVVLTFLFIDMFDTMGTLVGVCTKAGMMRPNGTIPGLNKAFMADAVATVTGACLGASTTTTYVESAAGVAQGGRTGLTALSTALCFVVALFFAPLFLAIPSAATAPVLIIVGLFMLSPIKDIDLNDYAESIPAFITIIMMPLTYSISDGILCGVIAYVAINVLCGHWKRLNATLYVLAILFVMKYIFI